MDIKRSWLVQLVAEEVQLALREFSHGEGEPKKKKGERPETKDAGEEPSKKSNGEKPKTPKSEPAPADKAADVDAKLDDEEDTGSDPVARGDGTYDQDDEGLPGDDEMDTDNADASSDKEDALDDEGDAGTEGEGEVADQIRGRTIDNISLEPESDLLPGSREIVLTFGDSPDILRIMVDGVGNIVFYLNGTPYDLP